MAGRTGVVTRLSAAVAAVAAAGLAAATALVGSPAHGASCAGVTTVVDFGALGGGVQERCVPDGGGRPAWEVFEAAGFDLTPVQQFPDAVCQVDAKPASDCVRMPPANAYWALFWSSGSGWVYSTRGPRSLTVPAGGSLGFAWQNSTAQRKPGAAPASSAPSPSPTAKPTRKPTRKPVTASGSASALPSASVSAGSSASPGPSRSATASAVPTTDPAASASTSDPAVVSGPQASLGTGEVEDGGGGLDWWIPAVALAALAGGGGVVWWRRRGTT